MTTPLWCLIIVAVLPYALAGVGAKLRVDQLGAIDNNHPRKQAGELEGPAARAYASQQNAWEALPFFTAAVVVNHLAGGDPGPSALAAMVFTAMRILHPIVYIGDRPPLRAAAQITGLVSCFVLFGLAARA